jgi:hypothetical protein
MSNIITKGPTVDEFFVTHYDDLLRYCSSRWNGSGQDVLHVAYEMLREYEYCTFTLFTKKAKEAARNLLRTQRREIPYETLPVAIEYELNICEICAGRISCDECVEHHLHGLLHGQLSLPFVESVEGGEE